MIPAMTVPAQIFCPWCGNTMDGVRKSISFFVICKNKGCPVYETEISFKPSIVWLNDAGLPEPEVKCANA